MKALDLFSGTHSFAKCCEDIGIEVITLDIDGRSDITCDILEWDYTQYPKDTFQVIWASPPCDKYSILQYIHKTKEQVEQGWLEADKLVLKTLEIIDYFNPELWFIENPNRGKLKTREFMKPYKYYVVDYCKYADWGYRKRTRIWTNKRGFKPLRCKKDCNSMDINNPHYHETDVSWLSGSIDKRHRIPPELIYSLLL